MKGNTPSALSPASDTLFFTGSFAKVVLLLLWISPHLSPGVLKAEEHLATIVHAKDAPEEILEQGGATSMALAKQLKSMLESTIQQSGPVTAIGLCKQVALPTTQAIGTTAGSGIEVKRTSQKIRNPKNQPDEIDAQVLAHLEELLKTQEADQSPAVTEVVVKTPQNTYRYYKPLFIQQACLTCHGDPANMPKELRDTISTSYPDDQATGYKLGELRGVICVSFP